MTSWSNLAGMLDEAWQKCPDVVQALSNDAGSTFLLTGPVVKS